MTRKRIWVFYCRPGPLRVKLEFNSGSLRHEAIFKRQTKGIGVQACSGMCFGRELRFEATATGIGPVPRFRGQFDSGEGPSGTFAVGREPDGGVLSLGLYGVPQLVRAALVAPSFVRSPLLVEGFDDCRMVLEQRYDADFVVLPGRPALPRQPAKRYYSGWCEALQKEDETVPPYAIVLAVLLLAYQCLLLPHELEIT